MGHDGLTAKRVFCIAAMEPAIPPWVPAIDSALGPFPLSLFQLPSSRSQAEVDSCDPTLSHRGRRYWQ